MPLAMGFSEPLPGKRNPTLLNHIDHAKGRKPIRKRQKSIFARWPGVPLATEAADG
jgi:hypothetical protein